MVGTIDFGGEPEAAVADGKGHIFVNIRSSSEIAEFDALTLKVLNRWPLAPGQRPNGLAIDAKNRRLFSGCNGNSKMVVMDADKGTVLATVAIGRGSDGCGFDPAKGLAYSANGGDGTVTVIGEPEPGKFKVVATIQTQPTARTMTLDPKTHRLYLSAATPLPAPPPRPASRRPRAVGEAMSRVRSRSSWSGIDRILVHQRRLGFTGRSNQVARFVSRYLARPGVQRPSELTCRAIGRAESRCQGRDRCSPALYRTRALVTHL